MDPADKHERHRRDLDAALRTKSTLPISRLLADHQYPGHSRRATFYAQSLSLVEFLTRLDSPREFVRFTRLSTELGHDRAMLAVYGIDSRELERRWHELVATEPVVAVR
jgi:hypothetical protein